MIQFKINDKVITLPDDARMNLGNDDTSKYIQVVLPQSETSIEADSDLHNMFDLPKTDAGYVVEIFMNNKRIHHSTYTSISKTAAIAPNSTIYWNISISGPR